MPDLFTVVERRWPRVLKDNGPELYWDSIATPRRIKRYETPRLRFNLKSYFLFKMLLATWQMGRFKHKSKALKFLLRSVKYLSRYLL